MVDFQTARDAALKKHETNVTELVGRIAVLLEKLAESDADHELIVAQLSLIGQVIRNIAACKTDEELAFLTATLPLLGALAGKEHDLGEVLKAATTLTPYKLAQLPGLIEALRGGGLAVPRLGLDGPMQVGGRRDPGDAGRRGRVSRVITGTTASDDDIDDPDADGADGSNAVRWRERRRTLPTSAPVATSTRRQQAPPPPAADDTQPIPAVPPAQTTPRPAPTAPTSGGKPQAGAKGTRGNGILRRNGE